MPKFTDIKKIDTVLGKLHTHINLGMFHIDFGILVNGDLNITTIYCKQNCNDDIVWVWQWFVNDIGGELDIPDILCYPNQ